MSEQKTMNEQANEQKPVMISDITEYVTSTICESYCHWPYVYGDNGMDQMLVEKCDNCPLNLLA